jgi:hypothetical protein
MLEWNYSSVQYCTVYICVTVELDVVHSSLRVSFRNATLKGTVSRDE